MLKGLKWFITLDSGIIEMIDFWTYIHEFSNDYSRDDYTSPVYDEAYEQ